MNKIILFLILCVLTISSQAQSLDEFLDKVRSGHPGIIAAKELLNAKEDESRTGINPDNPIVSFGYFPGVPESTSNKISWSVNQSIDFPSRYKRIKELKRSNYEMAELELQNTSLLLLNNARLDAIELISINEQLSLYNKRMAHINEMKNAYIKMLDIGESTVIELNKIRLSEASLANSIRKTESKLLSLTKKLNFVSNGFSEILSGASYPLFSEPEYETTMAEKKNIHPAFIMPAKELEIAAKNIALIKTGSLPGFELGFASEMLATERFTGPTFGMSIPLWKNKGKVKAAGSLASHYLASSENQTQLLGLYYLNIYNEYLSVKEGLHDLKQIYELSNSNKLLAKALASGEISLIEYFTELSAFYKIEDDMLELEREHYSLLSIIFDHKLIIK